MQINRAGLFVISANYELHFGKLVNLHVYKANCKTIKDVVPDYQTPKRQRKKVFIENKSWLKKLQEMATPQPNETNTKNVVIIKHVCV